MMRAWKILLVGCLLFCSVHRGFSANCRVSTTGVSFGNYTTAIRKVAGTVTVTCTKGVRYTISLNQGQGPGATVTNRSMTSGGNVLGYGLYTDAARTVNWGDSAGTNWVSGTGTGRAQKHNVYGEIPANEFSNVGSYADTVTVYVQGAGVATATASLPISGTVLAHCVIAASPLSFGTYTSNVTDATTSIDVTCTNNTSYTVGLNKGTSSGATVTKRAMTGPGGALLKYGLFSDSAHTVNWGNTAANHWVAGTGVGTQQSLTVYGEIPAGQFPAAGSYSDTIIARITY